MANGPADAPALDLGAYLRRIRHAGALSATSSTLASLHLAHASRIPFENLDILLGRPVRLDLASLQAKLVQAERGGYCFEHNLLFAAVLERVGFGVTRLAARVRYRARHTLPRTHMLLLVHGDDGAWIADVGFGLEGLLLPLPFGTGETMRQHGRIFRIVPEQVQWTLQMFEADAWSDLYTFTLEPQVQADYEMASHYTSTHPDSPFVRGVVVQLPTPQIRKVLRGRELAVDDGRSVARRTIAGNDELLDVLAGEFGLRFPAGTRFPSPAP